MTTFTRSQAELLEARRVRRYIQAKLKSSEDDRHWRRLEEQDERIRELTEREVMSSARRAHE